MELKQKFTFKTLFFMLASVFKIAPVLLPLFILIKVAQTVLGVIALYVLKDATNLVVELVTNSDILYKTIIVTFVYLILLLVLESVLK